MSPTGMLGKYFQTILELTNRLDSKKEGSITVGDVKIVIVRAGDTNNNYGVEKTVEVERAK